MGRHAKKRPEQPRPAQETAVPTTLCWDCANAVGWCSWSKDFTPVDGWDAEYVPDKDSYRVIACPLFERDALEHGAKRLPKQDKQEEA